MTREEAREILTHNWTRVDNPNYSESELDEAFFMAIEALQADAVCEDTQTEERARFVAKETELAHIEAKLENAEKRLQGACTANFVAEQLDRLRNMTDEERWDFFIKFFSPSADTVSREFYEDAVKANIGLVKENRELKEQIESAQAEKTYIGIDIPYGSDKGIATIFKGKDDKLILEEVKEIMAVVRCKDCRHRDLFSCPLAENDFQKDDDFCSWGERKEPLPQYEEWQDEFNKMCESARPKTFVADEWYRDTFKGEEE